MSYRCPTSFIDDDGEAKLGESDISIVRSGAMTVSEVCVVGCRARRESLCLTELAPRCRHILYFENH